MKNEIMSKVELNDFKEDDKKIILEQYRILTESLNNTNIIRESSNNFWMTVNGIFLSGIAYIKESQLTPCQHKTLLLSTMIFMGVFLCLFWINFLNTIKKTIQARNALIVEIEKYLPIKMFTRVFSLTHQKEGVSSLTLKELLVPITFLIGYFLFGGALFFFTAEVVAPSKL